MKIGLIDVDGHNFPNLALMRISAYHKSQGDEVEWCFPMYHYDIVYQSKVFSDAYSPDIQWMPNADKIIKGGTGYQIHLVDGKEVYDKESDTQLPAEVEKMFPDYSIYPQFDFAVSMTSRGCPRGCSFCHVAAKEGKRSKKVANVSDFWDYSRFSQKKIMVLDPNITACCEKRDLFAQYKNCSYEDKSGTVRKPLIDFTQGLDIRLLNEQDIDDINEMNIATLHFAWDNPKDNLEGKFAEFAKRFRRKSNIGTVYCLTNFNSTMEENLYRIYTLRDLGYDPYVMVYNKPEAPREIRHLQRWCNNKIIFNSCRKFEDYQK